MRDEITVIGGGTAGLVAAIACAEAGARVTLHEAHATLGGRARATAAPHVAHEGPHVFYADGPHWSWLADRGLTGRLCRPPVRDALRFSFVRGGRLTPRPPAGLVRMMAAGLFREAPVEEDFHTWATRHFGEPAARAAANAIAVVTYDADTGRLSAAFVWRLFRRVFAPRPPAVRWVAGGWQAVIGRLEIRARQLGVRVEPSSRITELPGHPTIVATELSAARALLGDESLRWESGHCVLLDLAVTTDPAARGAAVKGSAAKSLGIKGLGTKGLRLKNPAPRSPRDRFIAFDLDTGGFHESYSMQDPSTAPPGESLFQLDMPVRAGESTAQARRRLEALADLTVPGWRERVTWQRGGTARGRTGALDLPGTTWRDRPAVERGDGVFLAGDMVAAPGMRGEISINSALRAAAGAVRAAKGRGRAVSA
ncbi:NAD(P)/FAD-dependent oxidoreductase [Streptomyces sp. MST-110588]|uniref:NAD(P)/FAD-dependent oxidoreductase n=1 Tax=Streptomyces sp. MST-110588 TaxID=2833628 RepID=UPI001F5C2E13|nr:NAD(P)/FAD-dependent oxidoreductase [Streptomyces sp. MST-110588]UNO38805.1 NAD(P)-binding protein [Streptomyces sp. MST-110588]